MRPDHQYSLVACSPESHREIVSMHMCYARLLRKKNIRGATYSSLPEFKNFKWPRWWEMRLACSHSIRLAGWPGSDNGNIRFHPPALIVCPQYRLDPYCAIPFSDGELPLLGWGDAHLQLCMRPRRRRRRHGGDIYLIRAVISNCHAASP